MPDDVNSWNFLGCWNPKLNEPPIQQGVGKDGDAYICSHDGESGIEGLGELWKGMCVFYSDGQWHAKTMRTMPVYDDDRLYVQSSVPNRLTTPTDSETKDQIAAVMLQHGTTEQQLEALEYVSKPAVKQAPGLRVPLGWEVTRTSANSIRVNNDVVGYVTLYGDHADFKMRLIYMLLDDVLAHQETPALFGVTSKGMNAACEASNVVQAIKENMDKLIWLQRLMVSEIADTAILQAGKKNE